eukprot:593925-Prymnesium_polylepis.1
MLKCVRCDHRAVDVRLRAVRGLSNLVASVLLSSQALVGGLERLERLDGRPGVLRALPQALLRKSDVMERACDLVVVLLHEAVACEDSALRFVGIHTDLVAIG